MQIFQLHNANKFLVSKWLTYTEKTYFCCDKHFCHYIDNNIRGCQDKLGSVNIKPSNSSFIILLKGVAIGTMIIALDLYLGAETFIIPKTLCPWNHDSVVQNTQWNHDFVTNQFSPPLLIHNKIMISLYSIQQIMIPLYFFFFFVLNITMKLWFRCYILQNHHNKMKSWFRYVEKIIHNEIMILFG